MILKNAVRLVACREQVYKDIADGPGGVGRDRRRANRHYSG
jgi:hypothetical protein